MNIFRGFALMFFSVTALAGEDRPSMPWIEMQDHRFHVEIANNAASRSQGLMYREKLEDDHGMVFIFPRETVLRFWMKNTLIPLDIIFLDKQFRIVNIAQGALPCEEVPCLRYSSQVPAKYVIEVNAGIADDIGLQLGDMIGVSWNVSDIN